MDYCTPATTIEPVLKRPAKSAIKKKYGSLPTQTASGEMFFCTEMDWYVLLLGIFVAFEGRWLLMIAVVVQDRYCCTVFCYTVSPLLVAALNRGCQAPQYGHKYLPMLLSMYLMFLPLTKGHLSKIWLQRLSKWCGRIQ